MKERISHKYSKEVGGGEFPSNIHISIDCFSFRIINKRIFMVKSYKEFI